MQSKWLDIDELWNVLCSVVVVFFSLFVCSFMLFIIIIIISLQFQDAWDNADDQIPKT